MQTLVQKGLIEEAGQLDLPGSRCRFRTTDVFLRTFGIASLAELPLHGGDYAKWKKAAGRAAYSAVGTQTALTLHQKGCDARF